MLHIEVSYVSLAPTFFKNQGALTPLPSFPHKAKGQLCGAPFGPVRKKHFHHIEPTIETCFLIDSKGRFLPFVGKIRGEWPKKGHPNGTTN